MRRAERPGCPYCIAGWAVAITDPPTPVLITAREKALAERPLASIVIPVREPVPFLAARSTGSVGDR